MEDERLREEIHNRAEKLAKWLPILDEKYEGLISRPSELASQSGFDDAPRARPCEHRLEWQRGHLCLACDNTGWRRATQEERDQDIALDPYAGDITRGAVVVKESTSSRRAREAERRDAKLEELRRDARIRAGVEAAEDPAMRAYRIVSRQPRTVRRIRKGLELLSLLRPSLYEELPSKRALLALALLMYKLVPGRIPAPE